SHYSYYTLRRRPPISTLTPYTTLFRSSSPCSCEWARGRRPAERTCRARGNVLNTAPRGEHGHKMQATIRPMPGEPAGPALADAALPPRVRAILGQVRALAAGELGPPLEMALDALEAQLFEQAESARNSHEQSER